MSVSAVPRWNWATRSGPAPFDISRRVTYNLALDAKYCRIKAQPLTADLVSCARAVKEYMEGQRQ
jgi:hypothetical protein